MNFESGSMRLAKLTEALEIIHRCVQRPNPPILVGASRPRMLDLAGRASVIVGIHPRMGGNRIDQAAVADLTTASIEAKIERVRAAAADVGRPTPASNSAVTTSASPMRRGFWTAFVLGRPR
jgi:alkanesulfonate monooxygenase SsuD/methylene tetrahydromethanopterin reductase-like flavin-dependent oxidoreductase (luciferase family)